MKGNQRSLLFPVVVFAVICWTVIMAGLYIWGIHNESNQTYELSKQQARSFFQNIVTARHWNATHGGVYVPITAITQPNPYLDVPDRDVVTATGVKLTKINPAFMTRQIGEIAAQKNSAWFRITSTQPIRPANAPDPWELFALKSFSAGSKEYSEFIDTDNGKNLFRYMAPLWVERPCLKCHAKQGYTEGDLRGGISVTLQADPILDLQRTGIINLTLAYGGIWIIGLVGMAWGWRRLNWEEKQRMETIAHLQNALGEVKTLSGLLPICASCKKIRDDSGYWNQIEGYIRDRSEAEFSHGICPECAKKLYPDLKIYDK